MFPIRPPVTPPLPNGYATTAARRVVIIHPHYTEELDNTLLSLFAPDKPSGGLQYDYVLVVCGIIAGNRWDGWLTDSKDGPPLVKQPDEILPAGNYYFHLQSSTNACPYPIVPSFHEWVFPHTNLPPSWKIPRVEPEINMPPSSLTAAVKMRDMSCRMTSYTEGTQVAHICPSHEADWCARNRMRYYLDDDTKSIKQDAANAMLLRADLHASFDMAKFVFVPKSTPLTPVGSQTTFVTHILRRSSELEFLYHNRSLQGQSHLNPELLFARLAWSIFPLLEHFLGEGVPRQLTLAAKGGRSTLKPKRVGQNQCKSYIAKPATPKPNLRTRVGQDRGPAEDGKEDEDSDGTQRKRQRTSPLLSSQDSSNLSDGGGDSPKMPSDTLPAETPSQHPISEGDWPIDGLRRQWLDKERARSDPEHTWQAEESWARRMMRGDITMDQEEAKRLFQYHGAEFSE